MVEERTAPAEVLTVPNAVHVVPSVEYCHVPLPVTAVTTRPSVWLSASAATAPPRIAVTVVPPEVVSSFVPVRATGPPDNVGAALSVLVIDVLLAAVRPPDVARKAKVLEAPELVYWIASPVKVAAPSEGVSVTVVPLPSASPVPVKLLTVPSSVPSFGSVTERTILLL